MKRRREDAGASALTGVSATKSSDRRRLRSCGIVIGARVPRARLRPAALAHRQPLLLVELIELLGVELDAPTFQHPTRER
jgi:hypothetical protein